MSVNVSELPIKINSISFEVNGRQYDIQPCEIGNDFEVITEGGCYRIKAHKLGEAIKEIIRIRAYNTESNEILR